MINKASWAALFLNGFYGDDIFNLKTVAGAC
jgi:hypothetical protein